MHVTNAFDEKEKEKKVELNVKERIVFVGFPQRLDKVVRNFEVSSER